MACSQFTETKQEVTSVVSAVSSCPFEQAIKLLTPFVSDLEVQMFASSFISELKQLQDGTSSEAKLAAFNEKLEKSKQCSSNDSFKKAVDEIRNALPLNVTDFSTLENISPASRIRTSNRHQFDINSLAQWINTKGEYRNPYNQQIFSEEDQKSINKLAESKGLKINMGHRFHVEEHPAMLAGAIFAMDAVQQPIIAPPQQFIFAAVPAVRHNEIQDHRPRLSHNPNGFFSQNRRQVERAPTPPPRLRLM